MSKTNTPAASSVSWKIRFTACWREKLWLIVITNILFWAGYLFLSRHSFFPVHELPLTWLDKWAGFKPHPWAWVYESNFVLVGITPWLLMTREDLRRYVSGFALLSAISFLIFALYPVAAPRPDVPVSSRLLVFITTLDGPLNAFPSLHAGTLVYALYWLNRLFRLTGVSAKSNFRNGGDSPPGIEANPQVSSTISEITFGNRSKNPLIAAGLLVWSMLILFSTLATKQHYAIDLIAGGVLGWIAAQTVWRRRSAEPMAAPNTRRSSDVASHVG